MPERQRARVIAAEGEITDHVEADARGLLNLKTTVDALPRYLDKKNVDLFTSHKIYTEAEMEAVLDPKLYIGRCPEQVDAFLAQVRPLLSGASREVPEISL